MGKSLCCRAVCHTVSTNHSKVRRILIDDPEFIFPPSLQQVALYRSMQQKSTSAADKDHNTLANKKMKVSHAAKPTQDCPGSQVVRL